MRPPSTKTTEFKVKIDVKVRKKQKRTFTAFEGNKMHLALQ